ncbi:MAG TPA: hypothetical protein VGT40_07895 [Methylomirabilota bacterium]|nr:hypothetical protein [Methylomirabilota bacterium]
MPTTIELGHQPAEIFAERGDVRPELPDRFTGRGGLCFVSVVRRYV